MLKPHLNVGEPAPWFSAIDVSDYRRVAFDELAGSHVLLFFFKSADRSEIASALPSLDPLGEMFDGKRALFLGVTGEPDDLALGGLPGGPGYKILADADGVAGSLYGANGPSAARFTAFVLSPALQILGILSSEKADDVFRQSRALLGDALQDSQSEQSAPVLVVPHVFDSALCSRLIGLYEANGGRELGQIENRGQIVERADAAYRQRLDYFVSDPDALQECRTSLERRLLPLVYRAFQFSTTRIERYLVGCYDSTTGGYFKAHRDNTARPVAHRRFALALPLNDGYEGGRLRFPEFGDRQYLRGAGDAIVFACSLLHEVTPVTAGRRYAFISFLYDEQGQRMRDGYAATVNDRETESARA